MKHFEVFPVPQGQGWLMVADFAREQLEGGVAAMFGPEYRQEAQEFADRLNVRELAGRS